MARKKRSSEPTPDGDALDKLLAEINDVMAIDKLLAELDTDTDAMLKTVSDDMDALDKLLQELATIGNA